jgi:RNA recognition motif-containing protein
VKDFAIIDFKNEAEALKAIKYNHNTTLYDDYKLHVDFFIEKK